MSSLSSATPLITNDASVVGLLSLILGFVFYTSNSQHPIWKKLYKYIPALLLCYLLPSLLNTFGIVIGGSANMLAMKEIYGVDGKIFTIMVTVDIVIANLWMAYFTAKHQRIDAC